MKTGILFLSVMLLFFGCDNNSGLSKDGNAINTESAVGGYQQLYQENITGKWKLMEIIAIYNYDYQNRKTTDYSNDNIVYDFQTDNELTVTGNIPNDLPEGKYRYKYVRPNVGILAMPGPNFTIDDEQYFCLAPVNVDTMSISGDRITAGKNLNTSKVFVKIK